MHVTGAVLAGGRSRRMGADKRWIDVDGTPMLVRAVESVGSVADEVVIVGGLGGRPRDLLPPGSRVVADLRRDAGPLGGIETALTHAHGPVVLLVAVDHPWIEPGVLSRLVERLESRAAADVVVLGTTEGPQPLVGAYRTRCLAKITRLLDAGERRAMRLTSALATAVLDRSLWRDLDPHARSAADVDTPEDLQLDTGTRVAPGRPPGEGR